MRGLTDEEGEGVKHADLEIDRCEAALARTHAELDRMSRAWVASGGVCCPGCMFGRDHSQACAKAERQAAWLVVLLDRRARDGDSERINSLVFEHAGDVAKMATRLRSRAAERTQHAS